MRWVLWLEGGSFQRPSESSVNGKMLHRGEMELGHHASLRDGPVASGESAFSSSPPRRR